MPPALLTLDWALCGAPDRRISRRQHPRRQSAGGRPRGGPRADAGPVEPASALASDQAYRESDLAIDYCEDVAPLSAEKVERIASLMREAGLTAKVSSIHVNGWFGEYDKLAMTRRLFAERFGIDLASDASGVVFAGDSPNDAPMFGFFENSVGVANVRRFESVLAHLPKYVTQAAAGTGFA